MLSDITIGQYFPGRSLLHRLDPRMKLVLTLLFIVVVFLPQNWAGLGAVAAFTLLCVTLSRLPLRLMWRSVRPVLLLVLFTSLLNMFYITGGTPLLDLGPIHITSRGVGTAVFIAVRIVCLLMGSSLLTYTTTPTALTDAIERLLSPLRVIRVNAHELAMMMTIALRFIPTLIEETEKIMNAQKARGAMLDSGTFTQRIKALVPILIPLFISAFRRADELAMAMECRCYHGGEGRTRLKQLKFTSEDFRCMVVIIVALVIIGCTRFFVPGLA